MTLICAAANLDDALLLRMRTIFVRHLVILRKQIVSKASVTSLAT